MFYSFQITDHDPGDAFVCDSGIIAVDCDQVNPRRLRSVKAEFVSSELELFNRLIDVICDLDPDIICGWEVQAASWGYLNARGRTFGTLPHLFVSGHCLSSGWCRAGHR